MAPRCSSTARPAPPACRSARRLRPARPRARLDRSGAAQGRRRARASMLNGADLVILCLPDDAAREAVRADRAATAVRVIDASTAHRTAPGWVYGFPEMSNRPARRHRELAARVAIPAAIRPASSRCCGRWSRRAVAADWPVTVNAVSGYSGGGKAMIAEFEDAELRRSYTKVPYRIYALGLAHKHVPEMQAHIGPHAPAAVRARRRPLCAGHDRRGAAAALRRCRPRRRSRISMPRSRAPMPASGFRRGRLAGGGGGAQDARSRGPQRHQPHEALRLRHRTRRGRRGWWRCSTISARAPRARRCRTSTSCWGFPRPTGLQETLPS